MRLDKKDVFSTQEKIQELADKLTTLKNERSDLEQRQAMLEKACQMRDEELRKVSVLSN